MTTQIGDVRMSYEMQPCGLSGRPINGGNHYANAHTIEDARDFAESVLGRDEYLGYVIWSVTIYGREMRFAGHAWVPVPGGRTEHEVIRHEGPAPLSPADLAKECYSTTVLDYYEVVHERHSDGSCKCGLYPPGSGPEERDPRNTRR